ncbi:MAG: arginyltransferase [Gammaproteobacteria bacterium]|nr:arginyltransferase [Gammaproteobacteria bacterium]
MSDASHPLSRDLVFYLSAPHACSYLPGREALTLFADPAQPLTQQDFTTLSELGFRRSGGLVYTPRCPACSACIPSRIVVNEFAPDRSQRRNWRANSDLEVRVIESRFSDQHIALYQRYIHSRHPDGAMAVERREEVERFFLCDWSDTFFIEFLQDGRPIALTVVDLLGSGLSAVYTFFDPTEARRGLGVYAVLSLVAEARRRHLDYVYLGYLIEESPKMAYKARYRPQEHFYDGRWQRL